jgi:hypothetical protein
MNNLLINIIGFQVGWFSCVLGAAHQMPWLGPAMALPILGWHLLNAYDIRLEFKLIALASLLGIVFDQALLWAGLLSFETSTHWPPQLLPLWMITLWLLFSTTLNVGLRWLRSNTALAIGFGLVGGPLAYLAAAELGAIKIIDRPVLFMVLGLGWGLLMPALLRLSSVLDGYASESNAAETTLRDV